jgi:endonuclease YncB( thermonuclease family)
LQREQVAKGIAWRYVQYDKKGEFTQVDQAAKAARKGLWADAQPMPPWEWRKSEKERKAAKKGAGVGR